MSSTFTSFQDVEDQTSIFGTSKPLPIWLQFVPGIVTNVVTSLETAGYDNERDVNSIIAKPHITDGELKFKSVIKNKYYPLFRGMVDVPVKGDPVLLCTFGEVNYYIGPLNTANRPNWNIDHMDDTEILDYFNENVDDGGISGLSPNFQTLDVNRLHKLYNDDLDDIDNEKENIRDIHGDMIFEGRHGNSIRMGSRDYKPYIFLSNGRYISNLSESTNDDCIIFMSSYGTIRQHFPNEKKVENEELISDLFKLSGDKIVEPTRFIGGEAYNYEYNKPQILHSSDRITINARTDGIYLSAFKDMYLGAGNTLNIITENETIIESSNIYLGKQAKEKTQPVVLGGSLRLLLKDIVSAIKGLKVTLCVGGSSGPIDPATADAIIGLEKSLDSPEFFSEYHFVEDNGTKPE